MLTATRPIAAAIAIVAAVLSATGAAAFTPDELTNLTSEGDDFSNSPSTSADGDTFVVFTSGATNLTGNADNGHQDVFASVNGTILNLTPNADGFSASASISADGSTIVFVSGATNLTGDPDNGTNDVFMWRNGSITNLTPNGDSVSSSPSVSADGSTIAFESFANNLTGDPSSNPSDIFVWQNGAITNITAGGNGNSLSAAVSADGTTVVFDSFAANLTADPDNGQRDVFMWQGGSITNLTPNGDSGSDTPAVSADGTTIAFESFATNLTADPNGQRNVFVWDDGAITNLTPNSNGSSFDPSISANGTTIAFQSAATNLTTDPDNGQFDVFVWDDGEVINLTPTADANASNPSISANGTTIAFDSAATNLTSDADNGETDVFVMQGLDTTDPTVTLEAPASVSRYAPRVTPTFSCDDNVAIATCTMSHPNGIPTSRNGNQIVRVTATDTSGNQTTETAVVNVDWTFTGVYAGVDGTEAIVARFYAATFGRLPDTGGYEYWIGRIDGEPDGLRFAAEFFTTSPEFEILYGDGVTDEEFVDTIYLNVLGRNPEGAGRTFWITSLGDGTQTRGSVMTFFANSPEHKAITGTQ